MKSITVTELRANMKELVERVKRGEELEITQNGEVAAVMLHPSRLRHRVRTPSTLKAESLLREFEALRQEAPQFGEGFSEERAQDLVQTIRDERDSSGT